jgi:hypothetical protein
MYITANDYLRRVLIATLIVMIALAGLSATQVRAAEVQAETVDELIAAITAANASGEPTVIVLADDGDYVLTSIEENDDYWDHYWEHGPNDLPVITGTLTIKGNGATIRRDDLDSTPAFRIFKVSGGQLHLDGLTVSNGMANQIDDTFDWWVTPFNWSGNGGGILNVNGTVTLTNSTISGNITHRSFFSAYSAVGGGIDNRGELFITDSVISANKAYEGGGIYNAGDLTLTNSEVTGNTFTGDGGGIYNGGGSGTVTLIQSTISWNVGGVRGGGIYHSAGGTLTIDNSRIIDNSAISDGGGIFIDHYVGTAIAEPSGTVTLIDSTISANSVRSFGGGIANLGTLILTTSTVTDNDTKGDGGGLFNGPRGHLVVTNSTITNNTASSDGGGLHTQSHPELGFSTVTLTHSTVAGNTADHSGGGIFNDAFGGSMTLTSTLVAGNSADSSGPDVHGNITSDSSYNIVGDGSGTNLIDGQNGNQIGDGEEPIDPLLEQLQDNGGPTVTMALLPDSPAIDAIPEGVNGCGSTITTDQRGVERPQGGGCDIGAFELVPGDLDPLPQLTITASSHTMTYGDPVPGITPSYEGFVNDDTPASLVAQPVCSTTATSSSGIGAYETSCSGAESLDYEIHYASGELDVDPRPITVKADSHVKSPGEDDPDLSYQVSEGNLTGNDELTGELEREPGEEPGTYQITQGSLAAAPNYDLTFVDGTLTIGYGVCLDFDNSKVKKAGSVVPIRLMLCDSDANNVSSDGISLAATSLVRISSGTSGEIDPDSAGNANPDGDFRFAGDRYVYNLGTKGMPQGTWQLSFVVNGSESPNYRVEFQLAR